MIKLRISAVAGALEAPVVLLMLMEKFPLVYVPLSTRIFFDGEVRKEHGPFLVLGSFHYWLPPLGAGKIKTRKRVLRCKETSK
jgi:hypothetical protein